MTQIIVDPSELRRFEAALRELRTEIDARRQELGAHIGSVRSFWDDEKYSSFERRSEVLLIEIQYFTKLCDRYCEYLGKKAAAAEAYLGR